MKIALRIVGLSLVSTLAAQAPAQSSPSGSVESAKASDFATAVKTLNKEYVKELNSPTADPAKLARMYTEDAIVIYPFADLIAGRQAIEATYRVVGKNVGKLSLQTVKLASHGNLGYEIGNFNDTISDRSGRPVRVSGTYLTVWEKQANGSWLMAASSTMNETKAPEFAGSTAGPQVKRRTTALGGDAGERVEQIRSAIADRHSKFVAAFNSLAAAKKVDRTHIESLTSLYTPDATLMFPGRKAVTGTAAIGSFFMAARGAVSDLTQTTLRVRSNEGLAYEVGSLSSLIKDADGTRKPVEGYYLTVWQQRKPTAPAAQGTKETDALATAENLLMVASGDTDLAASPSLTSKR